MYSGQAIVLRNLRQIPPNTAKVIRLQKQFVEAVQRYQVSLSLIVFISITFGQKGGVCVCVLAVCAVRRRIFFFFSSTYFSLYSSFHCWILIVPTSVFLSAYF